MPPPVKVTTSTTPRHTVRPTITYKYLDEGLESAFLYKLWIISFAEDRRDLLPKDLNIASMSSRREVRAFNRPSGRDSERSPSHVRQTRWRGAQRNVNAKLRMIQTAIPKYRTLMSNQSKGGRIGSQDLHFTCLPSLRNAGALNIR